jgi:outer membrane protein TolC
MTGILALILMAGDGSGSPVDLSGWVSQALAKSPAVAGAEAALSAAQAELKASGAFLWPTLSFSASSGYAWVSNQPDGAGHTGSESYTASLALSQELLGAGGGTGFCFGPRGRAFRRRRPTTGRPGWNW